MGVHAALRSAQEAGGAATMGVVVSGVLTPGSAQVTGTPLTDASGAQGYLSRIAAWIPSEALALWLALAGPFDVEADTPKEFALVAAVLVVSTVIAWTSASAAHTRRGLQDAGHRRAGAVTAIAAVAVVIWWAATPGTWLTADVGVPAFWVALVLGLFTVLLPLIAQRVGVEPRSS